MNETLKTIHARQSVRAFLDRPVEREELETILEAASRAPSGVNTQPWRVEVVTGATKQRITDAILAARQKGTPENPDYRYYPEAWREPYRSRRKTTGMALYGALGIALEETTRREEAWYDNYRFFGAPVGLLIFMPRDMGQGSWLDLGMFMQNLMLAAQSLGLGSCPQASLADYPDVVREILGVEKEWLLLGGLSLGHPDPDAPANRFRTEREPVERFTRWWE